MNTATIIALLPFVFQLIRAAEKLFTEPGQGEVKKQFVVDSLKAAFSVIASLSTGGQKITWDSLAPVMNGIIDTAVGLFFPSEHSTGYKSVASTG